MFTHCICIWVELQLTIKILITLVEKSLLLKVVLFIGDGDFIGVLVFWSCMGENVQSINSEAWPSGEKQSMEAFKSHTLQVE